ATLGNCGSGLKFSQNACHAADLADGLHGAPITLPAEAYRHLASRRRAYHAELPRLPRCREIGQKRYSVTRLAVHVQHGEPLLDHIRLRRRYLILALLRSKRATPAKVEPA